MHLRSSCLKFIAALPLLSVPCLHAASLVEVQGAWTLASPAFYSTRTSGTYYNPANIERNGFVFMFTQGGQFSAASSPWTWCGGDMEGLWRAAASTSGLHAAFTPLRRVSRCDTTASTTVHWGATSAYFSTTANQVYLFTERQAINNTTHTQIDSEVWLLTGAFNANQNDIPTWNYYDLFSPAPALAGQRLLQIGVADDTTRMPPSDGYSHELLRGFGKFSQVTVEIQFDFSAVYCTVGHTSSSINLCSLIELKSGGNWTPVVAGSLTFTPDTFLANFHPSTIVHRNGAVELWGTSILTGNSCPCNVGAQAGQFAWKTLSSVDFSITGTGAVTSQLRCMPAEPAALRNAPNILVLSDGTQYILSGQNDDSACGGNPFVGMDVISTRVQ